MLQQEDAHVRLGLDAGLVERRIVPAVPGIGIRPRGEEEADDLGVPEGAGIVQGDEAAVVTGVHVGPHVKQVLHGLTATIALTSKRFIENPFYYSLGSVFR